MRPGGARDDRGAPRDPRFAAARRGAPRRLPVPVDLRHTAPPARPHRLSVRTPAFQAGKAGSIPAGDAISRCAGRTFLLRWADAFCGCAARASFVAALGGRHLSLCWVDALNRSAGTVASATGGGRRSRPLNEGLLRTECPFFARNARSPGSCCHSRREAPAPRGSAARSRAFPLPPMTRAASRQATDRAEWERGSSIRSDANASAGPR